MQIRNIDESTNKKKKHRARRVSTTSEDPNAHRRNTCAVSLCRFRFYLSLVLTLQTICTTHRMPKFKYLLFCEYVSCKPNFLRELLDWVLSKRYGWDRTELPKTEQHQKLSDMWFVMFTCFCVHKARYYFTVHLQRVKQIPKCLARKHQQHRCVECCMFFYSIFPTLFHLPCYMYIEIAETEKSEKGSCQTQYETTNQRTSNKRNHKRQKVEKNKSTTKQN